MAMVNGSELSLSTQIEYVFFDLFIKNLIKMDKKTLRRQIRNVLKEYVNELIDAEDNANTPTPGVNMTCTCHVADQP
jgi:hypothetical protein